MTIEFNCPHCNKPLKTSDDRAGRQAKCPGCGIVVNVPDPASSESLGDASIADQNASQDVPLEPPSNDDLRPCPACGEQVSVASVRCRSCGEIFVSSKVGRGRNSGRNEMRPFPPGEVIADAWRIFTERMGFLIGSFLIFLVLTVIVLVGGSIPFTLARNLFDMGNSNAAVIAGGIAIAIAVLSITFANFLLAGYLTIQIKVAREQPVDFDDLLSGRRFALRMIINIVLYSLMVAIGIFPCFIPGVMLALMFFPFAFVLVDEDRPGIESLIRAKELTDGNWGSIALVAIVAAGSVFAGVLACYVGAIIAIPFAHLIYAVAYDRMTCQTRLPSSDQSFVPRHSGFGKRI